MDIAYENNNGIFEIFLKFNIKTNSFINEIINNIEKIDGVKFVERL
jgi:hypothetical protein